MKTTYVECQPCKNTATQADGSNLPISGYAVIPIEVFDIRKKCQFSIMPTISKPIIIGMDLLTRLRFNIKLQPPWEVETTAEIYTIANKEDQTEVTETQQKIDEEEKIKEMMKWFHAF